MSHLSPAPLKLGAALSDMSAGGVGTLMFANNNSGVSVTFGTVVAGSSLRPATAGHTTGQISHIPAGTWRCMGCKKGANTAFSGDYETTLWQRIS